MSPSSPVRKSRMIAPFKNQLITFTCWQEKSIVMGSRNHDCHNYQLWKLWMCFSWYIVLNQLCCLFLFSPNHLGKPGHLHKTITIILMGLKTLFWNPVLAFSRDIAGTPLRKWATFGPRAWSFSCPSTINPRALGKAYIKKWMEKWIDSC